MYATGRLMTMANDDFSTPTSPQQPFPVSIATFIALLITSNSSGEKKWAQNLPSILSPTPSTSERQGLAQVDSNPHHTHLYMLSIKQGQTSPTSVPSASYFNWPPPKPPDLQQCVHEMMWQSMPHGVIPHTPCGLTNHTSWLRLRQGLLVLPHTAFYQIPWGKQDNISHKVLFTFDWHWPCSPHPWLHCTIHQAWHVPTILNGLSRAFVWHTGW